MIDGRKVTLEFEKYESMTEKMEKIKISMENDYNERISNENILKRCSSIKTHL